MISLLIITHEEGEMLSRHLPALLSQQDAMYEVVIVDMNSKDNTIELLTALEEQYTHLRHLSLPYSARDISHERLALHLGLRATISSRVLILHAATELPSPHWVADIKAMWNKDSDILLVPVCRKRRNGWGDYFTAGHEAWRTALYHWQALRFHLYRADSAIVGLDKDIFLKQSYAAHILALKTGALDIFVAQAAKRHNIVHIAEKDVFPKEDAFHTSRFWSQKRLFDIETRRHLPGRTKRLLTYLLHCLRTPHRGAIPYCIMDMIDYIRWCLSDKKVFIKKHY